MSTDELLRLAMQANEKVTEARQLVTDLTAEVRRRVEQRRWLSLESEDK